MLLLADSGSTKTTWCLVDREGERTRFQTSGMNPYQQGERELREVIERELYPRVRDERIEAVRFYGAGCAFPEKNRLVAEAIGRLIPVSVTVESDLLGAARALCGTAPGIACVLGTGSNTCLYDGRAIADHIPPLGFILGDEGSGASLGRRLAGDCLKRRLPRHLAEVFLMRYGLDEATLLERVYRGSFPNRFLASLSPFLLEHIEEPEVRGLVCESFGDFFRRNVMGYAGYRELPVHFVGSIAFYYEPVLREVADRLGIQVGQVAREPMGGLVRFHRMEAQVDR